jgi:hypothetical protein
MVVGRILRATACPNCRVSILRSFASLAGPPVRTPQISARLHHPSSYSSARFSSKVTQEDGTHGNVNEARDRIRGAEDDEEVEEVPKMDDESLEGPGVPWYLQVNTSQRSPQLLSERQRIPDLPESPPPILQPLLQQLSIDLGLDNLSLLDLRKLDPPPALGANLMMVIGTARSEKHLHVSADRLCRWLRSTYRLRPDADGLLGRNELKLKFRRKLRRAKLLGSTAEDNGDDGVRTGWICVDVGAVESSGPVTDGEPEPESFVGFGRRTDGVRLVVQMLTEEKREESDLEKLWGGILKRGTEPQIEEFDEDDSGKTTSSAAPSDTAKQMSNTLSSMHSQSRGSPTSAFHKSAQAGSIALSLEGELPSSAIGSMGFDRNDVRQAVMQSIASGNFDLIKAHILQYSNGIPHLQNESWRLFLLDQLRVYLESIPRDRAIGSLGTGPTDHHSTPFLASFYNTLSTFPSNTEGDAIVWLYCYAMEIGHGSYGLNGLMDLFTELQLSGVAISSESYLRLLRNALRGRDASGSGGPSRQSTEAAIKILQAMHDQGHKVLTEEAFLVLQEATAPDAEEPINPSHIHPSSSDTFDIPSLPMTALQHRIHISMKAVDIPFFQDETRLRLLDLYSRQHYWREFWDIFRMAARHSKPQPPLMYTFMFSRVAETRNQKACMAVLRTWIPEMDLENPKVLLEGDVAESVMTVLKVADPHVEQEAAGNPSATGEWIGLWRRCMAGLEARGD